MVTSTIGLYMQLGFSEFLDKAFNSVFYKLCILVEATVTHILLKSSD